MHKKILKFALIFAIIFAWVFGYPPVYENFWRARIFNFPPKIQEAQAADITLRGTPKLTGGLNGADITLTFDTGGGAPQTGDVVIFFGGHGCDGVCTAKGPSTAGYTLATSTDGADVQVGAWYKVMGGTPDLTVVGIGGGDTGDAVAYGAYVIDGTTLDAAIFDQTATKVGQVTGVPNAPAIVTQTAGAMVIALAGGHLTDATPGTITGYTNDVSAAPNDTDDITLAAATKIVASPATEDPAAWSSWTSANYIAITIALKPAPPSTTLGGGTNPGDATVGPGGAATEVDSFTFQTSAGTDVITSVTTTLAINTTSSIAEVAITSDNGATVYGSSTNPATNSFTITLNQNTLTASTTQTQFKIRITPKSHANMPTPPGSTYTVTSTITAWGGTNTQAGSDASSSVLTIDNASPANVTNASTTAGSGQVAISWDNPGDGDFSNVLVIRATSTPNNGTPTEGSSPNVGDAVGNGAVIYNLSGTTTTDTGLTNGTTYYYKIFAKDTNGNYSQNGVEVSGTPAAAATISCSTNISSTSFSTLTTASVFTSSPNASTTMSCSGTASGCTLFVKDAGNGSSPGLATTSPAYLIPSATATLSAGTEGYGVQATTTASGSGGTLGINSIYNKTGNDVGGLSLTTVTLASSTVDASNREVVVTHKAAISNVTLSGSYTDTITYSCVGN